MNRRGFLAGILGAGVAPAVVGSGVLMPVRKLAVPEPRVLIEPLHVIDPGHTQVCTVDLRTGDVFTIAGVTRGNRKNAALELFVVTAAEEKHGLVTIDFATSRGEPRRRIKTPSQKPWPRQGRWA